MSKTTPRQFFYTMYFQQAQKVETTGASLWLRHAMEKFSALRASTGGFISATNGP